MRNQGYWRQCFSLKQQGSFYFAVNGFLDEVILCMMCKTYPFLISPVSLRKICTTSHRWWVSRIGVQWWVQSESEGCPKAPDWHSVCSPVDTLIRDGSLCMQAFMHFLCSKKWQRIIKCPLNLHLFFFNRPHSSFNALLKIVLLWLKVSMYGKWGS